MEDYAIGMIKVDGLEPTPEMRDLIEKESAVKLQWKESKRRLTDDIR